ncbi:ImmA/IrrE family metallo-endopeptidase [Cytophagales bacterium LB-30]|uniref:ImmA/IrrE family metallo-endopeptidase n=1 Tax=Shiella aurantiaca TaxID=3058365 RepID=A0ABT8F5J5_9BACT|nr:ImmA/IrrE family metallo-endopeptidase [Shiella aurantiaca]MDN4165653.1 ImmA/IrrE family metallo-endopeptidase [Shiella aurantiaca]
MRTEVDINANMLTWAIDRAGYDLSEFFEKMPQVTAWINGEKKPTVKQLESFSKKVHLPFGYLFLPKPPNEPLPIPFFRTNSNQAEKVSVNVYDTILILQQRQSWLKEYLEDNDFEPLKFVGQFKNSQDVSAIVNSIRETLGLAEDWARHFRTWQDALNHLVETIEDKGIITVFNGVVENNTSRPIEVDECRGFVLVDDLAPFMFINNTDGKAAQLFTIVHELAHIWTGHSAGFDFRTLQPADDPIEVLCDKVAAEFLVPESAFSDEWSNNPSIQRCSRFFKVSEIVIARRALDTGKISRNEFFAFYEEYKNREFVKKQNQGSGGDFYATVRKRLSLTFASHINNAVKTGQLLYRDAYKLTSLKGDTFDKFFAKTM